MLALGAALSTSEKRIFLATQKDPQIDDPLRRRHLSTIGVIATVVQNLKLPNGNVQVMVEGVQRGRDRQRRRGRRRRHRRGARDRRGQLPAEPRSSRTYMQKVLSRSSSSTPRCRTTWRSKG